MSDNFIYGRIENIYYDARLDASAVCGFKVNHLFYNCRDKTLCEFAERCYIQDFPIKFELVQNIVFRIQYQ